MYWRAISAGEKSGNLEVVLRQMADAVIGLGQQNAELLKRLEGVEGVSRTLDRRDLVRSEEELLGTVEKAIMADEVQGNLASKSPKAKARFRDDVARAFAARLQAGEKDTQAALKASLQENLARLEDYHDGFSKADVIPIGGLPSRGASRGLEPYRPTKAPEPVPVTSPQYGEYLKKMLEHAMPEIIRGAEES